MIAKIKKRAAFAGIIAAILCLCWGTGWAQAKRSLTPAERAKAQALFTLEPLPASYQYYPGNRKDPFESLLILKAVETDLSKLPEIQRLDAGSLKVKGVAIAPDRPPVAMLLDPATNKYYYVKPGDRVGRNQGVVTSVTADEIVIRERFRDFLGKITTKNIVLKTIKPLSTRN